MSRTEWAVEVVPPWLFNMAAAVIFYMVAGLTWISVIAYIAMVGLQALARGWARS